MNNKQKRFIKRYFPMATCISLFMAGFIVLHERIVYGEIKPESSFWLFLGCGLIFLSITVLFLTLDFYKK